MKVLLVDPLANVYGLNVGIAYLSAVLINSGHRVRVLDFNNIRWENPQEKLRQAIAVYSPDVVGFSVQCIGYSDAKEKIAFLRTFFNGPIIVGGPEPTIMKEQLLSEMPEVNIVVVGEAEYTFPELAGFLERGEDLSSVKGIIWKKGKEVIVNPARPMVSDLDNLPLPNYDVFGLQQVDYYVTMTSRGCPFNCAFCFSYLGRTWRGRDPKKVVEELKLAKKKYGIKMFRISEPIFNFNPERVEKFCDILVTEKINLPWIVMGIRADRITDSMMGKLVQAGCRRLLIGVESLDPEVFQKIGKKETIKQIREGIKIAQRHDIDLWGYMIMGLPGDTFKKTIKSFTEAQKLNLTRLAYASAVPYDGTRLKDWVDKHATLYADAKELSTRGNLDISFATPEFTLEERIHARKIIAIKSRNFTDFINSNDNILVRAIKRVYMVLRYDRENFFHQIKIMIFKENKDGSQLSILNENKPVFSRVPDGTWECEASAKLEKKCLK
ncbi:B12-binding domain-containing radical SAM protein [Candidatus Margulisiibacteriota bacterium]